MNLAPLDPQSGPDAAAVVRVARAVADQGGRALLVGGDVRDRLLARLGRGNPGKDLDVEVFGLSLPTLTEVLSAEGVVDQIGASFAVLMVHGLDVDFSLPRRDRKDGLGHRGFAVEADPTLSVADAARRRDFTINSISMDPLTGEIIDPVGGLADLEAGILRPTDAATFGDDPLRALRAVQLAARFDLDGAPGLVEVMKAQDLSELPAERVLAELGKLLLKGRTPSRGLGLLIAADGLRFFPELGPAERLRTAGALLDRWVPRRPAEEAVAWVEGLALLATRQGFDRLAERIRPPIRIAAAARALLAEPALPVTDGDVRRLARRLGAAGTSVRSYAAVTADRAAADALEPRADLLGVADEPLPVAVRGRDLIARGMTAGKHIGRLLRSCLELQDETGETSADALLAVVLDESA